MTAIAARFRRGPIESPFAQSCSPPQGQTNKGSKQLLLL